MKYINVAEANCKNCYKSVSYTHLLRPAFSAFRARLPLLSAHRQRQQRDQREGREARGAAARRTAGILLPSQQVGVIAVSYTHLDVYKRQHSNRARS